MRTAFVYCLLNPEGGFDYVGLSGNPKRRMREHRQSGFVLQEVPWEEGPSRERFWIQFFIAQGCKLRNQNLGGGGPAKHTEEAKAKITAAQIGKKLPPRTAEHCAKLREAAKKRRHSAVTRARMIASRKGKKRGAYKKKTDDRARICAANHLSGRKGKKRGPYKKRAEQAL